MLPWMGMIRHYLEFGPVREAIKAKQQSKERLGDWVAGCLVCVNEGIWVPGVPGLFS